MTQALLQGSSQPGSPQHGQFHFEGPPVHCKVHGGEASRAKRACQRKTNMGDYRRTVVKDVQTGLQFSIRC